MRVLVTGGAGFIGSHLVEQCIAQGYYTVVLDNLSAGKKENIHPKARFYQEDIGSPQVFSILLKERIDAVFHQAGQTYVSFSLRDPSKDALINIIGTINLLDACRRAKIKKVIYASSAAVYGNPRYLPVDENHALEPRSGYGISKQIPERYLALYKQLYELDYTVLRYANVYGPRQDASGEGGVVAVFIDKLMKGEAPCVFGDGEQTRDFVYVEDVVRANLLALYRGSGQVLNIGTGVPSTINELVSLIKKMGPFSVESRFAAKRTGDIRESYLDPGKAKEVLGWTAQTSLAEGIEKTLRYYIKQMEAKRSNLALGGFR
ncbi:MAG: NAD-dependent epimerase/dehydratase family protein [Clostridia bacterium]|jgi:UDP-glucose 4-epimerase|nr:NAD-dependent epimerase/dehydratase family protein [Clostridia bacterium]